MYNQLEICKARSLFITRGILKRDIISDPIIYSWVRSKLHNISYEILEIENKEENLNLLSLDKFATQLIGFIRKIPLQLSRIYLVDLQGNILFYSGESKLQLPSFTSFREDAIGTTAAGISINTGQNSTVFGCEHYNKALINYISESMVMEEGNKQYIVQVISPIRQYVLHQRIISQLSSKYAKEEEERPTLTDNIGDNDDKSGVNPVKTQDITPEKQPSEIPVEANEANKCKQFTLSVIEKKTIENCLEHYKWNLKRSAEALGIGRSTLYRKLKEYGIKR